MPPRNDDTCFGIFISLLSMAPSQEPVYMNVYSAVPPVCTEPWEVNIDFCWIFNKENFDFHLPEIVIILVNPKHLPFP